MNIKSKVIAVFIFAFSLFLSGCGPGQLLGATLTPTPTTTNTPTLTPTPTATQTSTPTPTMTPTPTQIGGGSGKIVFETGQKFISESEKERFIEMFPDLNGDVNIFIANIDSTNIVPITGELDNWNFIQDISPDGTKLLISSSESYFYGNLYSIDLSSPELEPIKLASDLPEYSWQGLSAKWVDNTKLVFIGKGEVGFGIYSVNSNGSNQRNIYKYNNDGDANKPVELLSISDTRVYWASNVSWSIGGNKSSSKSYPWWSNIDGDGTGKEPLEFDGKQIEFNPSFYPLSFSPDGNWLAWREKSKASQFSPINRLRITSLPTMDNDKYIDIMYSYATLKWWGDSSKILVFDHQSIGYSYSYDMDVSEDIFGLYTISIPSLSINNGHRTDVLYTLIPPYNLDSEEHCSGNIGDFSPDGRQLLVFSAKPNTECETRVIYALDLETMTFSELPINFRTYRNRGYWLP